MSRNSESSWTDEHVVIWNQCQSHLFLVKLYLIWSYLVLVIVPLVNFSRFIWYCFGARGVSIGSSLSLHDSDRQIFRLCCSWHPNLVKSCGKCQLPRRISATDGRQTSKKYWNLLLFKGWCRGWSQTG
jgi:hypothetical protein